MKAVILSGGKGISLPQRGDFVTKALISVNGKPLIYYILKHFYFYGIKDIVLCVDSRSEEDINKFLEYQNNEAPLAALISKLDLQVVSAGQNGKTGTMLITAKKLLKDDSFLVAYNDTITDVNISQLIQFHRKMDKIFTVIGVHPTVRHGVLTHKDAIILKYSVDEQIETTIKGSYFAFKPEIFDYLSDDCVFEDKPFRKLISQGQAVVFEHHGFWKQFDSYKNIEEMERLFKQDNPTWMIK